MEPLLKNNDRFGIGGNNPPSQIEIFEQEMLSKYPEYFNRAQGLLDAKGNVPDAITEEDEAKKVGDYLKQIKELTKVIDSLREGEKQPYLEKCRIVDGCFGKWIDNLKQLRKAVEPIQAAWVEAKKAAERKRKEEEAARKREEEERKLREAQEAARKAQEAREEAARIAREEQARLDAERKAIQEEADRKRREQEAEIARLKKEQEERDAAARAEIEALRAAKEKRDAEASAAIAEAERKRKEEERAAKDTLKAEENRLKEVDREKREEEKRIREQEKAAEEQRLALERHAKSQERESNRSLNEAMKLEKQADRIEKSKDIDSRVRGDQGSLSTTRIDWDGHLVNRAELDLEALRPYFREDDINFAIKQFVKAGHRELKGACIFEDTKLQVR